MNGDELATQFRNLVDDDFDTTHMYQLFSQAKNNIERTYKPEVLKKLDQTQTSSVGDSYNTAKALPADFRTFCKVYLGRIEYLFVTFEQSVMYRNAPRKIFANYGANTFSPTGPVSVADTWSIFYIPKTEDFTEDNADEVVCLWPSEFHPLIPYEAAKIYQANIDADAIAFRMSAAQEKEYDRLLNAFIHWDHDIKLAAMNGQTGFADQGDYPIDIGML
ncbi:MAG: hypothetical protein V4478_03355 [Patescibacteria group bacterium]